MRITLLILPSLLVALSADTYAQQRQKPMQPFRSELWQLEFRAADKKDSEKELLPDSDGADAEDFNLEPGEELAEVDLTAARIPGQIELQELQDSTPIAEWQVDNTADSDVGQSAYRNKPSAWHLSQVTNKKEAGAEMAKGPTATTYLVGFMACIVVVGALLTGRE